MNQNTIPPMIMPGMAPTTAQSTKFTPVDPVRLLKQYKWLLLITAIIGIGAGIGLHYVLLRYAPQYTSVRTVTVTPELTNPYSIASDAIGNRDALNMFRRTQALFIQADFNLTEAMKNPAVQRSQWFADNNNDSVMAMESLRKILTVTPVPDTQVITVSVTASRKDDAKALADAVVDAYIEWNRGASRTGRDDLERVFVSRRNRLDEEINNLRRQVAGIMDESELAATEIHIAEVDGIALKLTNEQEEMRRIAASAERNYAQLVEAAQSQTVEFTPQELFDVDNGPTIRAVDNRLLALREELRVARENYGPDHRTVRSLEDRIRAVEAEKTTERQRLLIQLQDVKIDQARTQLGAIRAAQAVVEQRLAEVRQRQHEVKGVLNRYNVAREELDRKQEALLRFEESLSSIDVARDHPNTARVSSAPNSATIPNSPSFPELRKVVPGVTLLLLMAVSGLVFLKEMLDSRIKSPADTKLLPTTNLLGCIPIASEDPSSGGDIEHVVARKPGGLLAENFRQLRTEVMAQMQRHRFKTLMMTGCQPRGGNTSIATNLAASVAYNGRRVLIIDANFRRPAVHHHLGVEQGPGLAELVTDHAPLDTVIQTTSVENLDVMAIGHGDDHILERVESDQFTQALRKLEDQYELIIIDAPPLSIVGDSRVLANRVDAVVLTVRAMQEKRGLVARMMRQMDDARAQFLGIVLNGVKSSAGGYYRRNYQAFYEYQNGGSKAERTARRPTKRRVDTPVELPEA